MRIIAGKHRGRNIAMFEGKEIRPTSARTREALFNILMHGEFLGEENSPIINKRVVDLFCGSGALGIEALSRGAKHVTFVDQAGDTIALVKRNVEHVKETAQARFLRHDSSNLPPLVGEKCHLAFLDPPYQKGLAMPAIKSLLQQGWLAEGAIIVAELSEHETLTAPDGVEIFDERKYGHSKIVLLRRV